MRVRARRRDPRGRRRTSRRAAPRESRTDRVTACSVEMPPSPSPAYGAIVLRDRVGFRPTIPQQDAGARIEPNPSEACAIGSMRAPTAAAAPPLEPPGDARRVPGFFVGP